MQTNAAKMSFELQDALGQRNEALASSSSIKGEHILFLRVMFAFIIKCSTLGARSAVPSSSAPTSEEGGPFRYTLWLSYAELYNDSFYDLLDVSPRSSTLRRKALDLRCEQDGQVYLHGAWAS